MAAKTVIAELLVEIGVDAKDAEKAADRISKKLEKVEKSAKGADGGVAGANKRLEKFTKVGNAAGKVANTIGAALLGVAGTVGFLAKEVLTVGGRFESLKVQLKTTTGSAIGAEKAFKFIRDFAKNTPFQVEQVTDAFVKLNNFGIEPTTRTLTAFGDFASAMGKTLNDFIEAVTDATTGEFERLKEFGIKTSSEGDRVKFTFRGITTEVGKNATEIQEFLTGISEQNFGGAMAEQMTTVGGLVSNLQDAFSELMNSVAQMGPLDEFKLLVQDLRDAAGGGKDGLAKVLAQTLTKAIRGVRNLLKGNLVPTLERLVAVLEFAINNFGKLSALFVTGKMVSGVASLASAFGGLKNAALGSLGPLGLVATAVISVTTAMIGMIDKAQEARFALDDLQQGGRTTKRGGTGFVTSEREGRLNERRQRDAKQLDLARENERQAGFDPKARRAARAETQKAVRKLARTDQKIVAERSKNEQLTERTEEARAENVRRGAALERAEPTISSPTKRRGGRGRAKKDPEAAAITSPTTVSEFFGAAARGELGTIADRTPSTRDIEPTVAVDITNNNFNFRDTFQITGVTDPVMAGKEVVKQVKAEFDRRLSNSGQQLATNVAR